LRSETKDGHLKAGHEAAFKPAKVVPYKPHKTDYEHQTDRIEIKKKIRDDDGAVIIGPRNFVTSPAKVGTTKPNTTFGGFASHIPDDYNYPKKV
jgi:hypothetical protein